MVLQLSAEKYSVCVCVCVYVQNSIRHNLSLHSRFLRMQNEGAGKSSWWVVNPEAVARTTSKTPRRPRAFTMDTKAYERQKRGRAQRQGRDLLTRAPAAMTQRPAASAVVAESSSLVTEEPRDHFGLEYRTRASSFGGRLSPIDARPEPDTADSMDHLPLVQCHYDNHFPYVADGQETLSETLADILAGDLHMSDISSTSSVTNPPSQPGYVEGGYDPPMPYLMPIDMYREPATGVHGCCEAGNSSHGSSSDISSTTRYGCVNPGGGAGGVGNMLLKGPRIVNRALNVDYMAGGSGSMPNLSQLLTAPLYRGTDMSRMDELKPNSCMFDSYRPHLRDIAAPSDSMTVKSSSCGMVPDVGAGANNETGYYSGLVARPGEDRTIGQRLDQTTVARILAERPHLMGKMQKLIQLKRQQLADELHHHQFQHHHQQQHQHQPVNVGNYETDFQLQTSYTTVPSLTTAANCLPIAAEASDCSANSFFPSDLDLNGVDFTGATMDCDIDQVISHELALDGKLDFMFDSLPTPTK